jgi:peptidoglycan-associated lipoprotein
MIPVPRGRGGWETRTNGTLRLAALILVCAAFAASGCSSSVKKTPGLGTGAGAGAGLGESNLGNKGSLAQFKKGELGAGEGGPLHDIHFAFNQYTIEPQDDSVLKANAQWLEAHPNTNVQIEGHCDERGSEEYNIALGAKRAQSAKDYLVTLGIAPSRISTISYGKELPLCTEHTEECWARNRRDHFVVSQ